MSFYGVHTGRETGVFESWTVVEPLVKGFPGAKFKKFKTKAEAIEFVESGGVSVSNNHGDVSSVSRDVVTTEGVHIFTDGAHSAKTKKSGFGVWFTPPLNDLSVSQSLPDGTTNQEAELTAIVTALDFAQSLALQSATPITIWTDSDYSMKCLLVFIIKWRKHGWTTSSGGEVKHRQLIERGADLLQSLGDRVKLRHIKELGLESHQAPPTGTLTRFVWEGNAMADKLATRARE